MPSVFLYRERQKASRAVVTNNGNYQEKAQLPSITDNGNQRREPYISFKVTLSITITITM